MCPNYPPWVNVVYLFWDLNLLCWTWEDGKLLKPMDPSLIHTQCFTFPVSVGTEHTASIGLESSWPHVGWGSFSDIWAVFRGELTLPTGPCSACPPAGEHLCEYLPDDAMTSGAWIQFSVWNAVGKRFSWIKRPLGWLIPILFLAPLPYFVSDTLMGDLLSKCRCPWCLSGEESTCQCRKHKSMGLIPGPGGSIPWRRK